MAARLCAVATRAHVAPAPRGVSALIEKKPATRILRALAHRAGSCGNEEVGGRPNDGREQVRCRDRGGADAHVDLPSIAGPEGGNMRTGRGPPNRSIERQQVSGGNGVARRERAKHRIDHLAQTDGLDE
jgi:hypothetical protein